MRAFKSILTMFVLAGLALAQSAKAPAILPPQFGGWQLQGKVATSEDPGTADAVNAPLLKEYGFTDLASATYVRDDGRKLTLKAARFRDASGAYGAFTYYKMPQMITEKIGDDAASLNERVLFYRGNILVDAIFAKLSAMSAAELRELAAQLPPPAGSNANLPNLPAYLPKQSYEKNSLKYAIGPIGLGRIEAPVSAELVDFNAGAEVVLARYTTSGGAGTLMLISYPTPQIAAEHLRRMDAARVAGAAQMEKRSGPIVAVASGLPQSEAQSLLSSVNYDADVTWNENTYVDKKNNMANLLVNVIWLCAIIGGLMLVAGLAFGGIRVFLRRLFPDRIFARADEVDFISLNLSEEGEGGRDSGVSSSIKVG